MTCEERSGFLFAHECDRPAAWQCTACGKSICFEHTRMGANGYTCITCMRAQPERQEDDNVSDDPYFYGVAGYSASYYDADDYAAFDTSSDAADDAPTGSDLGAS
ncbi:MAG: hypothetical protein MUF51_06290 [Vicinamibacteria bacterium]|jgi:hypothetical protein|nr:hypothetical protein [Vicinamibacteria bacterium]